MNLTASLNAFLDALPRPRLGSHVREVPAFRTCGVAGFYLALVVLLGGGLLAGRSLPVLAALAFTSGLSFFVYTYLRMWITGREELVLLEHVWFALACNTGALFWMGERVLPYLDVVSVALCPFLAAGRIGCTLVGCCHGQPSSVGIAYNEACARDGFPKHLVGVRLFPVPAIEAVGLLVIGASGLIALPFAEPGKVFAWYLLAYSVMRFGLEGIRGDRRPHWLGLSQARWMSLIEFGLALRLGAGEHTVPLAAVYLPLVATLVAASLYRWRTDPRRQLLARSHVLEVREQARQTIERDNNGGSGKPVAHTTSRHLTLAVSAAGTIWPRPAHISLSLPEGQQDLGLLCELAAYAFPDLSREAAIFTGSRVLHLLVPSFRSNGELDRTAAEQLGRNLYGYVLRRCQHPHDPAPPSMPEMMPDSQPDPRPESSPIEPPHTNRVGGELAWYFADVKRPNHR